jgi:oligopeptide/dipeptide ABC transporter ATP-binding protein
MSDRDAGVLRLSDVSVTFKNRGREQTMVQALDRVNLAIHRGETLCIVGESGSGKTTLMHVLAGLRAPSRGSILYGDRDLKTLTRKERKAFRQKVQLVFQDPYESLNPRHTIGRIVREPLDVHRMPSDQHERNDHVVGLLAECGLTPASEYVNRYPHQLSGGQRQRVAIAAAVGLRPDVLIADEPVSMLDVSIRTGILKLLLELKQRHEMTLVIITHDLSLAWAMADRVVVLYLGRVMELGPAEAVIRDPWNPYTRALLSAVPNLEGRRAAVEISPAVTSSGAGCGFAPRCLHSQEHCTNAVPDLSLVAESQWSACFRHHELHSKLPPVHTTPMHCDTRVLPRGDNK